RGPGGIEDGPLAGAPGDPLHQGDAMAESRLDLSKTARDKSIALLDPALAGATDLMLATKEAHWNVRGLNFAALHKLFDEYNAAMGGYVDELAERINQFGGHAHGTLQAAAK